MFQKVLVPLDGSDIAESALPYVKNLAEGGFIGEVALLSVIDIPSLYFSEGVDFVALRNAQFNKLQTYLVELQARLSAKGIKVKTEIMEGRAAQAIVDYAKLNGVDLIVIATHGYTGMKKLVFGSVALRVLHESPSPVLLIRPESNPA
jgi:nucleotide-binding universal stress UspA family protein